MAVREIVMFGDPILRRKAKRIHHFDPALPRLVADMFATMHAARGIGLAAPQIGLSIRLLVIELDDAATGRRHVCKDGRCRKHHERPTRETGRKAPDEKPDK